MEFVKVVVAETRNYLFNGEKNCCLEMSCFISGPLSSQASSGRLPECRHFGEELLHPSVPRHCHHGIDFYLIYFFLSHISPWSPYFSLESYNLKKIKNDKRNFNLYLVQFFLQKLAIHIAKLKSLDKK